MSDNRGSRRRTPFVLDGTRGAADGLDDQVGGAMDSIVGNFDGLTIVSAPDDEGSGWMGVEPILRPLSAPARGARIATRSFSGALSVASSMTEPPTIRTAVPASRSGSSRGGGVDANWLPSSDRHVLRTSRGKLRETELVCVRADERICFGIIGNRRFCRSKACKVKAHSKTRFAMMGARGGWFLPAKTTLSGEPTAFIQPFLDVNKITQETGEILFEMVKRTTDAWERVISSAQEDWEDLESRGLGNIQEGAGGGDDDDDVDDDDSDESEYEMCEGTLHLKKPPAIFVWEKELTDEPSLKMELDQGAPKNAQEAVEELLAAFGDLEGLVVESRRDSRKDALDVLSHVGCSVTEIVGAIDRINKRGRRWLSDIGSIDELRDETGRRDITLVEAVMKSMAGTPQDVLSGEVEELARNLAGVDADLAKTCTLLNNKIQALERKQVSLSSAAQASPGLTMSTPIFDDNGIHVSTLGRVMQENVDLKCANDQLKDRIEMLAADVTAQGGVILGRFTFTSELHLLALCMKECPNGEAFSAFVDPMVVFCHDAAYTPLTGWEALTKAMEKSGNFPLTDRKVVASYNAHHSWWFSEGKTVVAGKTLQAFASKEKWQGTGGMDGRRDEIELSLVTSADSIRTAIEYKLPAGSQLGQLALRMLEHTLNWFTTVFKHLDSEFVRLTQVNISEEETLILLSEEVIIMFDRFYAIRRKRMDFTVHGSRVEYMVRCIWLSMEVHMVMDEFTANGMKYNSTISAAFMRFLTKVTGGNAAAGVAGIVASLESKLKNLDNTLKEVKKEVVAAASRATSATNAAEDAKKSITKLYQANTTLKK